MALTDLLYRCPRCGHDPTRGRRDEACCPGCGTVYRREGACVVAAEGTPEGDAPAAPPPPLPDAWRAGVEPAELVDAMARLGGAVGSALDEDGQVVHEARALHHGALAEVPVRRGRTLVGFAERVPPGRTGVLRVDDRALSFRFDGDAAEETWSLDDVTGLQLASRALQVGLGGRVFQWTLLEDSPFRWEELLQALLDRRWRLLDRGEIAEYQPRLVCR